MSTCVPLEKHSEQTFHIEDINFRCQINFPNAGQTGRGQYSVILALKPVRLPGNVRFCCLDQYGDEKSLCRLRYRLRQLKGYSVKQVFGRRWSLMKTGDTNWVCDYILMCLLINVGLSHQM